MSGNSFGGNLPIFKHSAKRDIINNDPIDDTLHVIIVISNPCGYQRRYQLAEEFKLKIQTEPNVLLYVVELSYDGNYHVTNENNPRHLRLYTDTAPIWAKENMINMGIFHLLPKNWKAVAWIDADIEFENAHWALDTLKILNGSCDIVQLFSHCIDMDANQEPMNIFSSFGFQYAHGAHKNFWHPGFAWAMTRKAFDRIGFLYDLSILGSGDCNFAKSILGRGVKSIHHQNSKGYKDSISDYQMRSRTLRLGYVPGVIRHFFHGSKKNRGYSNRWKILVKHKYDPYKHVMRLPNGLLIPSPECPKGLLDDILKYFKSRKEDSQK
jgi:hypothetical protein